MVGTFLKGGVYEFVNSILQHGLPGQVVLTVIRQQHLLLITKLTSGIQLQVMGLRVLPIMAIIYGSSTPNEQMEIVKVADGDAEGKIIKGMNITNSAWTVECVKNGNGSAQKFAQGSWLKVTFTGVKADKTTASVDYYLAD